MFFKPEQLRLYAVTGREFLQNQSLESAVEAAIRGGVTMVQLREKRLDDAAFLALANSVGAVCMKHHIPFIVNDNVEIALRSGADGVHVGQEDLNVREVRRRMGQGKIVGVSAETVEQALDAEAGGADYVGVGAVFPTDTKRDAAHLNPEWLKTVVRAVKIPAVGIGGIHLSNVAQLAGCGLAGVAVVSEIFAAPDVEAAARTLNCALEPVVRR